MELKWLAQNGLLIIMPVISAAIGWFTNFIAVKMLLKPIHPKKILGVTFQGILPRRHKDLADKISVAIAKDFLTEENIIGFIKKVDTKEALQSFINKKWDEKIGDLISSMPMIQMFLTPDKIDGIRDKIVNAFGGSSDEFVKLLVEGLEGKIDLTDTIRENILAFDLQRLESIIEDIAHKEFRYIERLGGLIGFFIGLVQAVLVYYLF